MWDDKSSDFVLICFRLLQGIIVTAIPVGTYFLCEYLIGIGEIMSYIIAGILGFFGLAVTFWIAEKFSY
ncbi:hypothetical protein [Bacillus sp. LLTC93]|uniref:hypothetical protein n=1 Tax=Bacillus sp. LLTC93 TaxID=2108274 RepID=UPI000D016571|nr:hypothetical protein [Bacillus sp. LLTC93]PRO39492.1 hypothetical protein C6W18_19530 [Bacillus sp. LLTC93]